MGWKFWKGLGKGAAKVGVAVGRDALQAAKGKSLAISLVADVLESQIKRAAETPGLTGAERKEDVLVNLGISAEDIFKTILASGGTVLDKDLFLSAAEKMSDGLFGLLKSTGELPGSVPQGFTEVPARVLVGDNGELRVLLPDGQMVRRVPVEAPEKTATETVVSTQ